MGLDESTYYKPSRFEYKEIQINHCIGIIDEYFDVVEVLKKKKIKWTKTQRGKKRLRSVSCDDNCNHKKQNKKMVKKFQIIQTEAINI